MVAFLGALFDMLGKIKGNIDSVHGTGSAGGPVGEFTGGEDPLAGGTGFTGAGAPAAKSVVAPTAKPSPATPAPAAETPASQPTLPTEEGGKAAAGSDPPAVQSMLTPEAGGPQPGSRAAFDASLPTSKAAGQSARSSVPASAPGSVGAFDKAVGEAVKKEELGPAPTAKPGEGGGFADRIKTAVNELKDTFDKGASLLAGGPQPEDTAPPVPGIPQDQTPQSAPQLAIPQLQRAETVSLGLGQGKPQEAPLTFEQIKGFQREGISDLVSQLRTQRRLFG